MRRENERPTASLSPGAGGPRAALSGRRGLLAQSNTPSSAVAEPKPSKLRVDFSSARGSRGIGSSINSGPNMWPEAASSELHSNGSVQRERAPGPPPSWLQSTEEAEGGSRPGSGPHTEAPNTPDAFARQAIAGPSLSDGSRSDSEDAAIPQAHASSNDWRVVAERGLQAEAAVAEGDQRSRVEAAAQHLSQLLSETPDEAGEVEEAEEGPSKDAGKRPVTVMLMPPFMPGVEPTVAFGWSAESVEERGLVPCRRPRLYVKLGGIASNAVKTAFKQAGFRRTRGNNWNALWANALKGDEFHGMNRYQKVNHFPGTWELGRKDKLYRNIARMRRRCGADVDFVPRHYILPREADEWRAEYERHPEYVYIQKPCSSSRGRGIRVLRRPSDVAKDKECLVQQYITSPHLINGYKYDMRIYVVVTSFDPLRVYVYKDGLARFATEPYSSDESTLRKRCMHLTNYSINSKKGKFEHNTDEDEDGVGSKWSITALRRHMEDLGIAWEGIWEQVCDIVVKTMIGVEANVNTLSKMHVANRNTCYEVFGFDIVLDSSLRAYLLEVNTGPALQSPAPLDRRIKFAMVSDMMHLVGFVPYDRAQFDEQEQERRRARLTGIGIKEEDKPKKRDVKAIPHMDFARMASAALPDVVKELIGEDLRVGAFQRVFPCTAPAMNEYYAQFFEAQRYYNVLLMEWIRQTTPPPSRKSTPKGTPQKSQEDSSHSSRSSAMRALSLSAGSNRPEPGSPSASFR